MNYAIFFILLFLLVVLTATKWELIANTIQSNNESPSLKRWVVFLFSMLIVIIALLIVLLQLKCPDFVWYGLLGLVCTGLGLSVYEKVSMHKNKTVEPEKPIQE